MSVPRRILVPFDFTGPSNRACDLAVELAIPLRARITLLHVLEPLDIPTDAAERAALLASTTEALERAAARLRPLLADVETRVVEGEPPKGIEHAARDGGADLIVMGTHGRSGLARLFLGSVATAIVKTSSVPVMTVHEHIAVSRGEAGDRLARALASAHLERPYVLALSRGALTIATAIAGRTDGAVDLWGVEPVVDDDGVVLGAVTEDGMLAFDGRQITRTAATDVAVARARARLDHELAVLKGSRAIGDCWKDDLVLVADGLFSASYARVAVESLRKLAPRRIIVATPIVSRSALADLEADGVHVVTLERAVVTERCTYRDDVVPSDVVARELVLERAPGITDESSSTPSQRSAAARSGAGRAGGA